MKELLRKLRYAFGYEGTVRGDADHLEVRWAYPAMNLGVRLVWNSAATVKVSPLAKPYYYTRLDCARQTVLSGSRVIRRLAEEQGVEFVLCVEGPLSLEDQ